MTFTTNPFHHNLGKFPPVHTAMRREIPCVRVVGVAGRKGAVNTYKDAGCWQDNSWYFKVPRNDENWHAETVQDGEGQSSCEFSSSFVKLLTKVA